MMLVVNFGIQLKVKSIYVNSLPCAGVKRGERECLRIIVCETRLYHVPFILQCVYDARMKEVQMEMKRGESGGYQASCMHIT